MQFGSKTRAAWSTILLSVIPDSALSAIVAVALDGGLTTFIGVFLGIEVFGFVRWILSSVTHWALFALDGRQQMSGDITDPSLSIGKKVRSSAIRIPASHQTRSISVTRYDTRILMLRGLSSISLGCPGDLSCLGRRTQQIREEVTK
jgi:hypothetical protein